MFTSVKRKFTSIYLKKYLSLFRIVQIEFVIFTSVNHYFVADSDTNQIENDFTSVRYKFSSIDNNKEG